MCLPGLIMNHNLQMEGDASRRFQHSQLTSPADRCSEGHPALPRDLLTDMPNPRFSSNVCLGKRLTHRARLGSRGTKEGW